MVEVRPRADPAEFLQGAGPCSVAAWSMEEAWVRMELDAGEACVKVRECRPHP